MEARYTCRPDRETRGELQPQSSSRRRQCIRNPANCTYVARRYNLILLGNLVATINFPGAESERDLPIATGNARRGQEQLHPLACIPYARLPGCAVQGPPRVKRVQSRYNRRPRTENISRVALLLLEDEISTKRFVYIVYMYVSKIGRICARSKYVTHAVLVSSEVIPKWTEASAVYF